MKNPLSHFERMIIEQRLTDAANDPSTGHKIFTFVNLKTGVQMEVTEPTVDEAWKFVNSFVPDNEKADWGVILGYMLLDTGKHIGPEDISLS